MSAATPPCPTRRVGVLGCGSIGSVVARELLAGRIEGADFAGVCVRSSVPAEFGAALTTEQLIQRSDVVVEAAGQQAFTEVVPEALAAGCDVVAVSVGALADEELRARVCGPTPGRLTLASGAIGGLDLIRAAVTMGEVERVVIRSTKTPSSLVQPWMTETDADALRATSEPVRLYDGPIEDLVRQFPTSTNVAATVAMAVGDWSVVRGQVWADPGAKLTRHVIEVDADAGRYRFEIENQPSPQNPRSSAVVPWSVVRTLREVCGRSWRVA